MTGAGKQKKRTAWGWVQAKGVDASTRFIHCFTFCHLPPFAPPSHLTGAVCGDRHALLGRRGSGAGVSVAALPAPPARACAHPLPQVRLAHSPSVRLLALPLFFARQPLRPWCLVPSGQPCAQPPLPCPCGIASLAAGAHPAKPFQHNRFWAAGEAAVDLLSRLLAFDPTRRCSPDEALAHEYFAGMNVAEAGALG